MRKLTILYVIISILTIEYLVAQQNSLSSTSFIYVNEGIYGGSMIGYGIDLNYSRDIFKNTSLNLGFGKGGFSGKNTSQFELEEDEIGYLPLSRWSMGLDFSFLKSNTLNLSAGAEILISRFPFVSSIHKDSTGGVTFRQVSTNNFPNYLFHLKMENKLGKSTYWMTQFSYQPYFIDANEVLMLKTGIGYRF